MSDDVGESEAVGAGEVNRVIDEEPVRGAQRVAGGDVCGRDLDDRERQLEEFFDLGDVIGQRVDEGPVALQLTQRLTRRDQALGDGFDEHLAVQHFGDDDGRQVGFHLFVGDPLEEVFAL